MADDRGNFLEKIENTDYPINVSCDYDYVPLAMEHIESLGAFGIVFVSLGTIFTIITLYLSLNGAYTIIFCEERKSWKKNISVILFVYPVASLSSLVALAVPRAQLVTETVTQIYLTISIYRLYLLLIDVGLREAKKSPVLRLRVGPCCCWPCLPFPDLEMNSTNLSWLQIIVLQLPIVQTLVYCIIMIMAVENPLFGTRYGVFLQPLSVTSILLGLYGLSITMKTLEEVNSGSNLRSRTLVVQLVLLFSKLQGFFVKSLSGTGLFPCDPPITPQVFANFTYNVLMLIEMLFLGYAARHVYCYSQEKDPSVVLADGSTQQNREIHSSNHETGSRTLEDAKQPENTRDIGRTHYQSNERPVRLTV